MGDISRLDHRASKFKQTYVGKQHNNGWVERKDK